MRYENRARGRLSMRRRVSSRLRRNVCHGRLMTCVLRSGSLGGEFQADLLHIRAQPVGVVQVHTAEIFPGDDTAIGIAVDPGGVIFIPTALFRQQTRMGLGKFPGRGQCRKRTEGQELDAWVYDLCASLPVYRDLHYGHHSSFPEITKHSFVTLELDMLPI